MAHWLSRATDAFRKPPPAAPQPFNVRCDCGGLVAGERVSAAQKPACPECGRPVFVLPANVYPVSVKPVRRETPPSAPVKERTAHEPAVALHPQGKPDRRSVPAEQKPPAVVKDGILVETRTQILTPFRLIVAAISAIGLITGWGLWQRHRVEAAKSSVLVATDTGMKALRDGNFALAARELTRARDAVDLLHRTDPESNTIRRNCREAVAGNELSDAGVFDILASYAGEAKQAKPGVRQLGSRSRGSWLVLDAVIANPDVVDRPSILDMPLLIEGMRFRIEVDSAAIKTAARREAAGRMARVIFAAQLSEIRPPSADDSEAVLVLNGESAFLWSDLETYAALGYVDDRAEELDPTRELLARQLEQTEGAK